MGAAGHRRRPDRAPDRCAARLDRDAPERDDRRGRRPLVLRPARRAAADRLRGGELPVRALPAAGAGEAPRSSRRDGKDVAAIDERRAVPISHVIFKTGAGRGTDHRACVRRAHVADAYQSSARSGSTWCAKRRLAVGGASAACGGPGAGWLYVRPDLAETLEPTLVGWQAHARPFGFEPELEYAAGTWRFLTGTPNVPALYAATPGYDIVEEIGVDRIRANSVRQTELLASLLDEAGFEVVSPREPERRAGRSSSVCPTPRPCTRSSRRANHLRLPTRRRLADRAALLHHGRRARSSSSRRCARSSSVPVG